MSRAMRPASQDDVQAIERALKDVRSARANLRKAGAVNAARRVAGVVHSVEGALRHAYRRRMRTAEDGSIVPYPWNVERKPADLHAPYCGLQRSHAGVCKAVFLGRR